MILAKFKRDNLVPAREGLTCWSRKKMAPILQMDSFLLDKKCCILKMISKTFFLRMQLATIRDWFKQWLGAEEEPNDDRVHWRIYASPGRKGLTDRIYLRTLTHLPTVTDAYMRQWIGSVSVQIMACHLFGVKPLSTLIQSNALKTFPDNYL